MNYAAYRYVRFITIIFLYHNDNIFISYRIDINHISNVPFKTLEVMYVPPNLIQRPANRARRCLPYDSHRELRFFPIQASSEFYNGCTLCSLK
jgi:hypothetical protein